MKTVIKLVLASLFFGGSVANAALVNFSLVGVVGTADAGNDYGLAVNDEIYASGTFDDSILTNVGLDTVTLDTGSNSLLLEVGNQSFTQADDENGAGFPRLTFLDGSFTGLGFGTTFSTFSAFTSLSDFFVGDDDGNGIDVSTIRSFNGSWQLETFTVTAVPVPAAVWLFGSGLLGLAGVARRKSA